MNKKLSTLTNISREGRNIETAVMDVDESARSAKRACSLPVKDNATDLVTAPLILRSKRVASCGSDLEKLINDFFTIILLELENPVVSKDVIGHKLPTKKIAILSIRKITWTYKIRVSMMVRKVVVRNLSNIKLLRIFIITIIKYIFLQARV